MSPLSIQAPQVKGPGEEQVRTELVAQCRGADTLYPLCYQIQNAQTRTQNPCLVLCLYTFAQHFAYSVLEGLISPTVRGIILKVR